MAAVRHLDVLDTVRRTIEATLRIGSGQLDLDARFDSFGIDSIISMELLANLSKTLGVAITPTQFMNVATTRELSEYIAGNFSSPAGSDGIPTAPIAVSSGRDGPAPGDFPGLRAFIKDKYSIDPGPDRFATIDELVEALVTDHLEPLLAHYELFASGGPDRGESLASQSGDIAIVGISCRFPDAADPQRFWQNLLERRSSLREIPSCRWHWQDHYAPAQQPGRTISKWGALIDGVELFDAEFFGIPARDARLIDPQERLLCEEVYQAFQDAGVDTGKLPGSRTGVFVGYEYAEYEQRLRQQPAVLAGAPPLSSSSPAYYLANRLSYLFDLRGPSESINVNCASSALAINRACQSLLTQESDLAVAGGVSLNLFADDYIALTQHGLLSADGTCAVFDNDANGYTRGEGVAAIVLKRLEDARRDNDRIYALIKSCHQNNRGHADSLSTIRHESITEVIGECCRKAAIASERVDYIELNGYSKRWGDSFEFEGIRNCFSSAPSQAKHCALGSLKGNIGHLEPASGIASVIKVAMSLWNKQFPPTITKRTLNEFIDLDSTAHPLYFADSPLAFDRLRKDPGTPVRAGVNSFCDSGANVHILLEEVPDGDRPAPGDPANPCPLFVLSARNRARLDDYVAEFHEFLSRKDPAVPFSDMLYTLQSRREAMDERLAIVAAGAEELIEKLARVGRSGTQRRGNLEEHGIYCGSLEQSRSNSFIKVVNSGLARQIIERALQTRQWQELAVLWTNGAAIDWQRLWQHTGARPVSLPAYPFARQRHWLEFDQTAVAVPPVCAASPASTDETVDERAAVCLDPERFREAPRNDLECRLLAVWAEVLNLAPERIGVHDNFFELGGNSLLATQAVSRMRSQLEVNLPLTAFLNVSTIAGTAAVVASINYQDDDPLDENGAEDGFEAGSLEGESESASQQTAPRCSENLIQRQLAYWREQLSGLPAGLNLATDYPRHSGADAPQFVGATESLVLDSQLSATIREYSVERSCTLFMTLLAAFKLLLHRYTGQEDLCVGSGAGVFANALALRTRLRGEDTFNEVLVRVRTTCLEAYENQEAPFEKVIDLVLERRARARNSLFQVMVSYRHATDEKPAQRNSSCFDWAVEFTEQGAQLAASIEYDTRLYRRQTIERMVQHFIALCRAVMARPNAKISELEYLSEAEKTQLLVEYNDTRTDYPSDKCIHELFAEQAANAPDRIAAVQEDEQLTYRQLHDRSRELALYLQSLGVKPDQLIGLCVERSLQMLVGILGILQAGGAYVPLDPNYPDSRLEHLLRDSGAAIVLTQEKLQDKLRPLLAGEARLIALDAQWPMIRDRAAALSAEGSELQREVRSHHLAYVIYTSGSTGTPKGVMVEHRGVVNLVTWHRTTFLRDTQATTASTAGLGFDACAWEVHSALCAGATLLLPPRAAAQDPAQLIDWWSTQAITSGFLVTTLAEQVIAQGVGNSRLTTILMGGEQARAPIPPDLPFCVINNYGPTEITVVATSGVCEKGRAVDHIGRPIANTRIYILDRHRQPVPVGAAGEIYIGGAGVARGYLNRPELTQERFPTDPFSAEPGARMYRSGDLGRWRPEGTIEFLGRNDFQVKIRGLRIELGEIEAQLAKHSLVKQAVVLAREDVPGEKRLVAYVTTHDENGQSVDGLQARLAAHLKQTLPEYMVPSAFVYLDALPLTANGKVDRRSLEQLQWESSETYVAARNETEAGLIRIWAQLLNLDAGKVGVNDNFFELGGHSLLATQLISKIRNQLGIEIPLKAVFNANTVAQVAEAVTAIRGQQEGAPEELDIPDLQLEDGSL